jgi:O-acetyl-ADP-ribose deacetylase (regulator of RNase III)
MEEQVTITYMYGNLLASDCEALVNPVNCVGIMGKGLALQFKKEFDDQIMLDYKKACQNGTLRPGQPQFLRVYGKNTRSGTQTYAVINFPTKLHWQDPSRIEWIEAGLVSLAQIIKNRNLESIAIPPLGCGLGGLSQSDVRPLIEKYLGSLECRIVCYNFD